MQLLRAVSSNSCHKKRSLLNYVPHVLLCPTCLVPHICCALQASCLTRSHALMLYVPGAVHALVPHMPCTLHAVVPNMRYAPCAMCSGALHALYPMCSCALFEFAQVRTDIVYQ